MTDNKQKENISIAYLRAVCAKAKLRFQWYEDDDDGIDCHIRKDIDGFPCILEVQLKSTTVKGVSKGYLDDNQDSFTYPLKKKNYDDLTKESLYPRILMLLVLPENDNEWVTQDSESLVMRKCMYYTVLDSEAHKDNSEKVSVKINKQDICSAENLDTLLSNSIKEFFS